MPAIAVPVLVGLSTGHARPAVRPRLAHSPWALDRFSSCTTRGECPCSCPPWECAFRVGSVLWLVSPLPAPWFRASALWGFLYGTVWTLSPAEVWIALQCLVWLVISTAYPASGVRAEPRFPAGWRGCLQILCVTGFWRILGSVTPPPNRPNQWASCAPLPTYAACQD
jgi:hypothetical protein